jgi:hypothetical protein
MFSSVSSCAPNSQVTTSFRSTLSQTLDIWANIAVSVNGSVTTARPIQLAADDLVQATVGTPATALGYRFIPYTLDGKPQCFAVVNRNNYAPTVKTVDATRRWFNYPVFRIEYSFHNGTTTSRALSLGINNQDIDIDQLHVVCDPQNRTIHFYTPSQEHVASVGLPGGPIDYRKINYTVPATNTYTQDLIVLCNDGKVYRITYNRRFVVSDKFEPGIINVFNLDDLPFQEDIPGGGSFTDLARERFIRALFPVVSCLDVRGTDIWIAGQDTVYLLNKNFVLQSVSTISGETILGMACIENNGVIVTTKSHRVYMLRAGQSGIQLFQGTALGQPGTLPDGNRVAVPDPNNQRLLIFNSSSLTATWSTIGIAPAYARTFNSQLYVTAHDSNQVLRYLSDNFSETINFLRKVTIVDVVGTNIIGTHFLQDYTTLNLSGIQKIIPFSVPKRSGAVNHIGTEPQTVTMLGQESIYPIPGPGLTCWSNGVKNGALNTGSYFSVSFKGDDNGDYRSPFIIGETAIDYDVNVLSSSSIQDYYRSDTTALLRLTPPFGSIAEEDVGDKNDGIFGPIPIGFNFNMYGRIFNEIYANNNGFLYFGGVYVANSNPVFGNIGVDTLFVEPRDLYKGYPINNIDPLDIKDGWLDTDQVPGLYIKNENFLEFKGFRLRWVGTTMASYPLGNTIPTAYSITNWPELVMPTLAGIAVNDYISGTGVIVSTQVSSLEHYQSQADVYLSYGPPDNIYLTLQSTTFKKYSSIKIGNVTVARHNSSNLTAITGNSILASGATATLGNIIVDGVIDPRVNTGFVFDVPTITGTVAQPMASAIQVFTDTITPIALRDSDPTNSIYVSAADFNKVYVGQAVQGVGVSATVTSKSYTQKGFSLSAEYSRIAEGYTETIYTPPVFDGNGNIVVNGFWTNTAISGTTATIHLATLGVVNGATFPYTITGLTGNITSSDFVGNPPLSGVLTVNSSSAQIQLIARDDSIAEGLESFRFTVSNLTVLNFQTLSIDIEISENQTPISAVQDSIYSVEEYKLVITPSQTITAGNTINIAHTRIDFDYPLFFGRTVTGTMAYRLNQHRSFEQLPVITGGYYQINTTPVEFEGNFVQITNPATISAGTDILFKANVPAPTVAYEVGLYTGFNYQYIEYFFDSTHHLVTNVGIVSANGVSTNNYVRVQPPAQTSYVFGSFTRSGTWFELGPGSFTDVNQGFEPRHPRVYIAETPQENTELRYEILIDQKFSAFANVRYSIDYGYIYKNDGYYWGDVSAQTNDIITVVVPFGTSQKPTAPILGIGNYQVALPSVPWSRQAIVIEQATTLTEQPLRTVQDISITVPIAGEYFIPDYYRTTSQAGSNEIEYEFVRTRTGANTVVSSGYHEFQAGDVITLRNVITSRRTLDVREYVIVGPRYLRFSSQTVSPRQYVGLSYSDLNSPFVRYYNDYFYPAYQTANLRLMALDGTLTSNLFVTGRQVHFIVNGARTKSRYLQNISTGANIALEWTVQTYFESNAVIYQLQRDNVDGSNIFIRLGQWTINNKSVTGASLDFVHPELVTASTSQWVEPDSIITGDLSFDSILGSQVVIDTASQAQSSSYNVILPDIKISSVSLGLGNYLFTAGPILEEYLDNQQQVSAKLAGSDLDQGFRYFTGRIAEAANNYALTVVTAPSSTSTWLDYYGSQLRSQYQANIEPLFSVVAVSSTTPERSWINSWEFDSADPINQPPPVYIYADVGQETLVVGPNPLLSPEYQSQLIDPFTVFSYSHTVARESITTSSLANHPPEIISVFTEMFDNHIEVWASSRTGFLANDLVAEQDLVNISTERIDVEFSYWQLFTETLENEFASSTIISDDLTSDYAYYNVMTAITDYEIDQYNYLLNSTISEYTGIQLITPVTPITPELKIDTTRLLPAGYEYLTYNLFSLPIESEYIVPNDQYFDIDSEYLEYNLFLRPVESQYIVPNDQLMPIGYEMIQPPDQLIPIASEFEAAQPRLLPLTPLLQNEILRFVDFGPWFVQSIDQYIDFPAWFVQSIDQYIDLPAWLANSNDRYLPAVYALDQELMWKTQNWATEGTISTRFSIYADDGFAGNEWQSGKFIKYDQNIGSTLVMFNDTYGTGSFTSQNLAAAMAAKYVSAQAFQIMGTDFWNFRIYFDTNVVCTPRRGRVFPHVWLMRGG